MRIPRLALAQGISSMLLLSSPIIPATAFVAQSRTGRYGSIAGQRRGPPKILSTSIEQQQGEDCGCGPDTLMSGNPSSRAKDLNPREAVRRSPLYTVDGAVTNMDNLIGEPSQSGVSIVVFLRSFG